MPVAGPGLQVTTPGDLDVVEAGVVAVHADQLEDLRREVLLVEAGPCLGHPARVVVDRWQADVEALVVENSHVVDLDAVGRRNVVLGLLQPEVFLSLKDPSLSDHLIGLVGVKHHAEICPVLEVPTVSDGHRSTVGAGTFDRVDEQAVCGVIAEVGFIEGLHDRHFEPGPIDTVR